MARGRLDQQSRDEIALLLATGVETREIARTFRCSSATVYRYGQNIQLFGQVLPEPVSAIGRPRKITYEARQGLIDWLLDNGDDKKLSYLDEMVVFLKEEYDIWVSKSTVWRLLSELKITCKAVSTSLTS
jgi:transposase